MFSESDARFRSETTPRDQFRQYASESREATIGMFLIVIGAMFLAQHFLGFNPWRWSWPYLIVAPGVVFLVSAFAFGRGASGLAIPGSIITTLGSILLMQNTFNAWQTWAYAWALVVPTSIGIGLWFHGVLSGREKVQRVGRVMATIGLGLFLGFATLFEGILNLSHRDDGGIAGPGIAAILIVVGLLLISERSRDSAFIQ
jgi:hypothetical protein